MLGRGRVLCKEQRRNHSRLLRPNSGAKVRDGVLGDSRETGVGDFSWVLPPLDHAAYFPAQKSAPLGLDACPQLTPWVAKICVFRVRV